MNFTRSGESSGIGRDDQLLELLRGKIGMRGNVARRVGSVEKIDGGQEVLERIAQHSGAVRSVGHYRFVKVSLLNSG